MMAYGGLIEVQGVLSWWKDTARTRLLYFRRSLSWKKLNLSCKPQSSYARPIEIISSKTRCSSWDNCPWSTQLYTCAHALVVSKTFFQIYSKINIRIVLVAMEFWTDGDKIVRSEIAGEYYDRFAKYRKNTLMKTFPDHDNAQLMWWVVNKVRVLLARFQWRREGGEGGR